MYWTFRRYNKLCIGKLDPISVRHNPAPSFYLSIVGEAIVAFRPYYLNSASSAFVLEDALVSFPTQPHQHPFFLSIFLAKINSLFFYFCKTISRLLI